MNNPATYCNPIPLPDYPRGRLSIGKSSSTFGFTGVPLRDWRETADPSVLFHDGAWHLYPSCGMAYVSTDFVTWRHHSIEPYDCGYAPTVVKFRDKFLLTACEAPIYEAPTPLGPFTELGALRLPSGEPVKNFNDPMLFADDDGRLYAYWGLGEPGIFAAEVSPDDPTLLLAEPAIAFRYNPEHAWERYGDWNEDPGKSYVEGPWMLKHNGVYYLTYAAPGTEWRTYGMGAYTAPTPLGPFTYQPRNPILQKTHGLIQGPGHGCIVRGPNGTLWAFYTCTVCYEHIFERRVGFDPAGIDEHGNLFVRDPSEIPQLAPGALPHPELGNDAGWLPLTQNKAIIATSQAPGRDPLYANDGSMRTFWQPDENDPAPALVIKLNGDFEIHAFRIIWKDVGLDYDAGIIPGPFKYTLSISQDGAAWQSVVDATDNAVDMLIDYRQIAVPARGSFIKLKIFGAARGITPAVIGLTAFGRP
jgi:Beta-xylosidase